MPNEQLHTFPEGKVYQEDAPIRRLKWGTASLIVRAPVTPIVLPIVHRGFEQVSLCHQIKITYHRKFVNCDLVFLVLDDLGRLSYDFN